jgi:hypothetical protein
VPEAQIVMSLASSNADERVKKNVHQTSCQDFGFLIDLISWYGSNSVDIETASKIGVNNQHLSLAIACPF